MVLALLPIENSLAENQFSVGTYTSSGLTCLFLSVIYSNQKQAQNR